MDRQSYRMEFNRVWRSQRIPGTAISAIIAIVPIALCNHDGAYRRYFSYFLQPAEKTILKIRAYTERCSEMALQQFLPLSFGAPANTTYGENTGVLALSKVYDPRVIGIAAYFALLFSLSPKFAAAINLMPTAVIGGISFPVL